MYKLISKSRIVSVHQIISASTSFLFSSFCFGAGFRQFDENGLMKVTCKSDNTSSTVTNSLILEEPIKDGSPYSLCWKVGEDKICQFFNDEINTSLLEVSLECSNTSAKAEIPFSGNYPVSIVYKFKNNNEKLVFVGKTKNNAALDTGKQNYQKGLILLKAGKVSEGYALLLNANDDGCMSLGCRPSEELERKQNLDLAKTIGQKISNIASTFAKKKDYSTAAKIYEEYFEFCHKLNVFPTMQGTPLIDRLAKHATKDFAQLLNDWGYYLWLLKNFESAQKLFEIVIKIDPSRSVVYLNQGDVLWDLGKKDAAIIQYKIYANKTNPKKWPTYLKDRIK